MLGISLGVVGPVALIARQRAGFSTSGLGTVLTRARQVVVAKLKPRCTSRKQQEPGVPGWRMLYTCTQYNGDRASYWEVYRRNGKLANAPVDLAELRRAAGARSAYLGSLRAL